MPPVGFEPTVSAGDRPQTYALDGAATGIGTYLLYAGYKLQALSIVRIRKFFKTQISFILVTCAGVMCAVGWFDLFYFDFKVSYNFVT